MFFDFFKKLFKNKKPTNDKMDINQLDQQSMDMVKGIFDLSDSIVKDFIVPRTDVMFLDANISKDELFEVLLRESYSRYPVYEDNIDNVIGVLYTKDLLNYFINENIAIPNKIKELFVNENLVDGIYQKIEGINSNFYDLFIKISVFFPEELKNKTHNPVNPEIFDKDTEENEDFSVLELASKFAKKDISDLPLIEQTKFLKNVIDEKSDFFDEIGINGDDLYLKILGGNFFLEDMKDMLKKHQKLAFEKNIRENILKYIDKNEINIKSILRKCLFIPEMIDINELLKEMKNKKIHLAITLDEWGGVSGIVSMEDIIEEIFGQIQDEFDDETEDVIDITEDDSVHKKYLCNARAKLDNINELLGISLPKEEFESLSGYVFHLFKKIPAEGEKISNNNIDFIIHDIDNHKIKKVKIIVKNSKET